MSENNTVETTTAATAAIKQGAIFTLPSGETVTGETFFFRPKAVIDPVTGKAAIGEDGKPLKGEKRAPLTVGLPYTNGSALIELLSDEAKGEKVLRFITDLANDAVFEAAQGQINAAIAAGTEPSQDSIQLDKLDIYFLATVEKAAVQRGIPKELWADFKKDFIGVLTSDFGVSIAGAELAAKFIADDKLVSVQARHDLLEKLRGYMANWFTKTSEESQGRFAVIYSTIDDKITTYLAKDEASLLDAIA